MKSKNFIFNLEQREIKNMTEEELLKLLTFRLQAFSWDIFYWVKENWKNILFKEKND